MKRTILKTLVILAAAVSLSACALLRPISDRMADIHTGMSPEQVISIMGKPNMRSFDAHTEVWEYEQYLDESGSSYIAVSIRFTDGKVSGMDSYRVDNYPPRPGKPGKHDMHDRHDGHDKPGKHDGPDKPGKHDNGPKGPGPAEAPHPDNSGVRVHLEWK